MAQKMAEDKQSPARSLVMHECTPLLSDKNSPQQKRWSDGGMSILKECIVIWNCLKGKLTLFEEKTEDKRLFFHLC